MQTAPDGDGSKQGSPSPTCIPRGKDFRAEGGGPQEGWSPLLLAPPSPTHRARCPHAALQNSEPNSWQPARAPPNNQLPGCFHLAPLPLPGPYQAGQGRAGQSQQSGNEPSRGDAGPGPGQLGPCPAFVPVSALGRCKNPTKQLKGERCLVSGCEVGGTRAAPLPMDTGGQGPRAQVPSSRGTPSERQILPFCPCQHWQLYPVRRGHGEPQDSPLRWQCRRNGQARCPTRPRATSGKPSLPATPPPIASLVYMSCHLQSACQATNEAPAHPQG